MRRIKMCIRDRYIFFRKDGRLDQEKTYNTLGKKLNKVERAVIPGFYGCGVDGRVQTFSRGGSDVTGSVVAKAVLADMYENWTDVSGCLLYTSWQQLLLIRISNC